MRKDSRSIIAVVLLAIAAIVLLRQPAERELLKTAIPAAADIPMEMSMDMSASMGNGMVMDMPPAMPGAGHPPVEGQPLESFSFATVDGKSITSDSLRGSVVLLDVWASWCGPCREEMPAFEKLQARYRRAGLRVLGVSIDMTTDDAATFAREVGVRYPIVHDPAIMTRWGLLGLPTTLIIDRGGILRRMVIGFEYAESFEDTIRALL